MLQTRLTAHRGRNACILRLSAHPSARTQPVCMSCGWRYRLDAHHVAFPETLCGKQRWVVVVSCCKRTLAVWFLSVTKCCRGNFCIWCSNIWCSRAPNTIMLELIFYPKTHARTTGSPRQQNEQPGTAFELKRRKFPHISEFSRI
ncbi:unnamed protein product [Ectocarpus sp. 13 AM-2016]